MSAYDVLKTRGVTRLCHFTKFQSLTHIITSAEGILASSSIRQDTKNVNDTARYDGELDSVCCSVQYPNSWFLNAAMQNNPDQIFKDWVVLYVDLSILKYKNAKFCPCNASKSSGAYINGNMDNIDSIFATYIHISRYQRSPKMLSCCPTDGQAEILIEDSIPREYINGIAVGDEDVANRVYTMLKIYGMVHIPLYVAPDVLTTKWSNMIKNGLHPEEIQYNPPEED
jgi:hypothetical protein